MSISEQSLVPKSTQIGKAGELRVRAELILRGLTPAVCDDDDGTDIIIANNFKKLQVKTSLRPHDNKNYGWKYSFAIRQMHFRQGDDSQYKRTVSKKSYEGKADYFVFWCVEHDIFYIIPEPDIGTKVSFVVPTPIEDRTYRVNNRKSKSKYEKYRNAWHLLA